MTATIDQAPAPRLIHLSLQDIYAQSGAGFYGDFVHRAVATMQRARKSVLFAKMGMGKSTISAKVAVSLALTDEITVVAPPVMRSSIAAELREAGYDRDVNVLSPHQVARDPELLEGADMLLVCLDGLAVAGSPSVARAHIAKAAAKASRVVMYAHPDQTQFDFLNVLHHEGANVVAIHAN